MDGLKNAQYIKMPNNTLDVWIPNDFNSRKIQWTHRGGTRFLLGNPYQNWRAVSYDSISLSRKDIDGSEFGIARLELELSDINSGIDDLDNGIAWQDYF